MSIPVQPCYVLSVRLTDFQLTKINNYLLTKSVANVTICLDGLSSLCVCVESGYGSHIFLCWLKVVTTVHLLFTFRNLSPSSYKYLPVIRAYHFCVCAPDKVRVYDSTLYSARRTAKKTLFYKDTALFYLAASWNATT